MAIFIKDSFNSDGQQFHQYQQNKQRPPIIVVIEFQTVCDQLNSRI
jgi:hypothetical protein